jgi:predicted aldo/keto reductase-like oxidoreductase
MGGNNERLVGAALKEVRKRVYIATKVLRRQPAEAEADLATSLKELGTDYLDVWYLHDLRAASDFKPELIEVQQKAKREGKIRFTGFSVHMNHADVIPAGLATGKFDVLLTTYNYALGTSIDGLLEKARAAGIGIVAMKVMAGSFSYPGATDDAFQAKIKKQGAPVAALKWSLRNKLVDCAIPSIRDTDQLDEDITAMASPYGADDDKILSAALDRVGPLYCRGCGSCAGQCRNGLPVADVVRFAMYAQGYGEFRLARENFLALPEAARQVRCEDCRSCTVRCPNGVRVPDRLRWAQNILA